MFLRLVHVVIIKLLAMYELIQLENATIAQYKFILGCASYAPNSQNDGQIVLIFKMIGEIFGKMKNIFMSTARNVHTQISR